MVASNKKNIGIFFILIGLLINEVTIALFFKGWYAFYRIDLLLRLAILTFQGVFISIGWLIIKGRKINWFIGLYRDLSLFGFNLILLVGILLGGIALNDRINSINFIDGKVLSAYQVLKENPGFMKAIYPGLTLEEIKEIITTPAVTSHPTLEFMETPFRSKFYNVGFENMRYSFAVNETNAKSSMNGSTWVFGGSTVFGSGIADDDTIPAYLNKLTEKNEVFINFGVQANFLNNEIEKLLLLLKKGWRPKRVIFIDGLNDMVALTKSRFHPTETPGRNPFGFNYMLGNFDRLLDVIKVSTQRQFPPDSKMLYPVNSYENVYEIASPYNKYPVAFFDFFYNQPYRNLKTVAENPKHYIDKIDSFYRLNLEFLKHLASSFGFEFYVFYQPLGPLNLDNPFIDNDEAYQNAPFLKSYQSIVPPFRENLKRKPIFGFYDIFDADSECTKCYVDLTHYNPKLSAIIAQRILDQLDDQD
jgi:hypothetical protein